MNKATAVLFLLVATVLAVAYGAKDEDKITSLPGLRDKIKFNQYAGYMPVSGSKSLFYWFVESQNSPSTDPVVLWLQGGPGCSSLFGFFTEHGPFTIINNSSISLNPYSWNQVANMLYVEAPAGVGFSYYTQSGDRRTGDNITMADNYQFLQNWFMSYPEFAKNPFYVSGESYGGHYVPQLAWTITEANESINSNSTNKPINLKGIFVGNPWSDDVIDSNSVPYFIFYHHLCSLGTWQMVKSACQLTNPEEPSLISRRMTHPDHSKRLKVVSEDDQCSKALDVMYGEVGNDINQYNIYAPCLGGKGLDCSDYSLVQDYLNRADVQKAIHARKPNQPWAVCGGDIDFAESWPSVFPLYRDYLLTQTAGLYVVLYAGDVTFNVPALGTEIWVDKVAGLVRKGLQPFYYNEFKVAGQNAGYISKYTSVSFVTVKNSGHMVPTYTPVAGFELFKLYLTHLL